MAELRSKLSQSQGPNVGLNANTSPIVRAHNVARSCDCKKSNGLDANCACSPSSKKTHSIAVTRSREEDHMQIAADERRRGRRFATDVNSRFWMKKNKDSVTLNGEYSHKVPPTRYTRYNFSKVMPGQPERHWMDDASSTLEVTDSDPRERLVMNNSEPHTPIAPQMQQKAPMAPCCNSASCQSPQCNADKSLFVPMMEYGKQIITETEQPYFGMRYNFIDRPKPAMGSQQAEPENPAVTINQPPTDQLIEAKKVETMYHVGEAQNQPMYHNSQVQGMGDQSNVMNTEVLQCSPMNTMNTMNPNRQQEMPNNPQPHDITYVKVDEQTTMQSPFIAEVIPSEVVDQGHALQGAPGQDHSRCNSRQYEAC